MLRTLSEWNCTRFTERKMKAPLLLALVCLLPMPSSSAQGEPIEKPRRIAQIFIVGNTITRQDVILKAVDLLPGQILHYPDLRAAEKNLERLGIFAQDRARGVRPTVTVLDPEGEGEFK